MPTSVRSARRMVASIGSTEEALSRRRDATSSAYLVAARGGRALQLWGGLGRAPEAAASPQAAQDVL